MNEEDTFRKLARPLYKDIREMFIEKYLSSSDTRKCIFLLSHHWDPIEFFEKLYSNNLGKGKMRIEQIRKVMDILNDYK